MLVSAQEGGLVMAMFLTTLAFLLNYLSMRVLGDFGSWNRR